MIKHPPARTPTRSRGFTLLETALSTIIIGVGVLAVMEAQQAFLEKNSWSTNASTATFLANEVRERTRLFARHDRSTGGLMLTDPDDDTTLAGWGPEPDEASPADFDDLDDFDGAVFGDAPNLPEGFEMRARHAGPIDSLANVISETLWNGTTEVTIVEGEEGDEDEVRDVSLRGWTQCVLVEKVNPADTTAAVAAATQVIADGEVIRGVDEYPVRVTVVVLFQRPGADAAVEVARVSWVASP